MQAPYFSQGLNRYAYAFNDPVNHVDPSGFYSSYPGKVLPIIVEPTSTIASSFTYSFTPATVFGSAPGEIALSGIEAEAPAAATSAAGLGAPPGLGGAILAGALEVGLKVIMGGYSQWEAHPGGTHNASSGVRAATSTGAGQGSTNATAQNRPGPSNALGIAVVDDVALIAGATALAGAITVWWNLPSTQKFVRDVSTRMTHILQDQNTYIRKSDIREIDRIATEQGLDRAQRRRLHDEITGQDLELDEIRDIAKEIKDSSRQSRRANSGGGEGDNSGGPEE
jgi:hypothetical protein